jgi:hypothetical protein
VPSRADSKTDMNERANSAAVAQFRASSSTLSRCANAAPPLAAPAAVGVRTSSATARARSPALAQVRQAPTVKHCVPGVGAPIDAGDDQVGRVSEGTQPAEGHDVAG